MSNRKTESMTILPIYRLAAPQFSDAQLEELATRAFGMDSALRKESRTACVCRQQPNCLM